MSVDNLPTRASKKPPHNDPNVRARRAVRHLINADGTIDPDSLQAFQTLVQDSSSNANARASSSS